MTIAQTKAARQSLKHDERYSKKRRDTSVLKNRAEKKKQRRTALEKRGIYAN